MAGLILDFYWKGGEDPVRVSLVGSVEDLNGVGVLDPTSTEAMWPKSQVRLVSEHSVASTVDDSLLVAHICIRDDE